MDTTTVRNKFLEYFASHGHKVVRSSSLVPANDPTLFFTNAGMVQFKDVFTGQETRAYTTATSSQKCLRVSGKHNDLENVGRTSRHHTFFEMLGNFSFGDYFKKEAIHHAWDFLTRTMGLDPERLVASVFEGEEGVPADDEAFKVWHEEIGLPRERVLRLPASENFWSMGDVGPCGPCSEVHYHQGEHLPCDEEQCKGVACECDRWVEIWNLVFMQFDRSADGVMTPLKATGVDTGMGLERLAAVSQGASSTYETDLFMPLNLLVAEMAGIKYGDNPEQDVSIRVVADHARAAAFCIADGVFPEKTGREYVLRRIMRRAIRHGKLLGFEEPFLHEVCALVVQSMGEAFPELIKNAGVIEKMTMAEETSFRRTLGRGLKKLRAAVEQARQEGASALPVRFVGDLYATDGFPIDLTRLIAEESELTVDEEAAHQWVVDTHGARDKFVGDAAVHAVYKALLEEHGSTRFLGYEFEEASATVFALLRDEAQVPSVSKGQEVEIVLDSTPMYGKAGGQLGDRGELRWEGGEATVTDTLKPGGELIVHEAKMARGSLAVGDEVTVVVDGARRQAIRLNHSATHLMHHALRVVLGDHVAQKGSEVSPDALRFDFSHFEGMTPEELVQVEDHVNAQIRRNERSSTEIESYEEAQQSGAMALFGEKYGDEVRVVHIGSESTELCGGTHVQRAGDIGLFKIVSEEALAQGVRRIVARTGEGAMARVQQTEGQLRAAAQMLRCGPDQVTGLLEKLQAQVKARDGEVEALKHQLAVGVDQNLMGKVRDVNGVKLLVSRVDADPKTMRQAGDTLRQRLDSGVVVLGGENSGKATLMVMVSKDLTKKHHAGKIMKQLAEIVGGRGGGRPDMAQGGGPDVARLDEALEKVVELI